ncbi:Sulfurtransferase tusE [Escherichia coli]|nr:Sulfurtransferase tusE [Escherichia coli]
MLIFEGKEIETDTEGYLKESSQWSEPLAVVIAENEGISLSPEHWEVVLLCVISIWNSILLRRFVCW